ncbi:MAG: TetR/AcrR family transcriptional regulator [Candidatus Dormibacteraeota bacterium]|nr:TetR/AcrR family transcriptional regulator [Candidatus Dormibacteraeota bacterium]
MSPRSYRSDMRVLAATETRRRILEAARTLLSTDGPVSFTVDAVADQAGVARMTVYNRFGSKVGLVEAISDDLALRGGIARLPEAFRTPDALAGLEILVRVFVGLWESERLLIRRLRALTTLDPELAGENRNQRRRQALVVLLQRLAAQRGMPRADELETTADLLLVLTSFDAYELLAAEGRSASEVVRLLTTTIGQILPSQNRPATDRPTLPSPTG